MRLPATAHTSRPWRIREIAHDFRLEDVWELPGTCGPDDFPRLVEAIARFDPSSSAVPLVRALFAVRWRLGSLLGWDRPGTGAGERVPSLRARLPADLRDGPSGPAFAAVPFTSLYLLDDEWAAEAANATMHGVVHVGRVPDGPDRFRAHLAVYVKPNGLLGDAYMAAIKPFRYLIYPPMLREGARVWQAAAGAAPATPG